MKAAAAFIGPIVWDDDGPIPILNRSNTLIMPDDLPIAGFDSYFAFNRGMISRAMMSTWSCRYL